MSFALCAFLLVSYLGGQFTGPVITSLPLPSTTSFSLTLPTQASSSNGSAAGNAACKRLASVLPGKYSSALVSLPKYLQSRDYWNSRNDLAIPACAIYPTTSDDVALALKVIKSTSSHFAVRSKGGHQPNARFSSVDNGVLIDLSSMSNISYDATAQTVIYGPGNHYGDIYKYTEKYGVTVVGARLSGVGTGLGLGGGLSYLSGTYGMSCDAFRSLSVVLPNGTITEITAQSNPDLFTAMKGGGGNQLGIVTQYTVAARKIGKVWAGNLVMALNYSQQVLQVAADFARYNTDDKAATITTFEEVLIPDLAINLSEFCLVFLVYNGEDPGDVFKNFTGIPHLVNTGMLRSYTDATNMVPLSTEISKGQNFFRVSAFALDTDAALQDAYTSWKDWATLNKQSYLLTSLDVEPVPQSLLDASAAQGSNAMDMKSLKGPFVWVNWLITTSPLLSQSEYDRVQASFKAAAEKVPSTKGLPLFQNDAAADQNPISTYKNYPLLQRVKSTIDPDNFFTDSTGGWSFSAPSNYE